MTTSRPNILILTYWSYKEALVQTYTLPYVRMIAAQSGAEVFLVTLEQERLAMTEAERREATAQLEKEHIHPVFLQYVPFGMKAAFRWRRYLRELKKLVKENRIGTLHAWCTPAGAIGYFLARPAKLRFIIDSFEPHAESMVENGTWKAGGPAFRVLFHLEKKQARRADTLIALTRSMEAYAEEKYGVRGKKFYVKPACIDFPAFPQYTAGAVASLRSELGFDGKLVCVYAGKLGGIYLDREIFDFFAVARKHWGDRFRALLLSGADHTEVERRCREAGFPAGACTHLFLPQQEVPRYLAVADFALNPVKPVPSKRHCTSIKDGEYWASGLPVVIPPGISDDSDIIAQNGTGAVLDRLDESGYSKAIRAIDALLSGDRAALAARIRQQGEMYRSMKIAEGIYREIYGNP